MGLLDFRRYQAAAGRGGAIPAPAYGAAPTRQMGGGMPTTFGNAGPQPTGTYAQPARAPLPSLSSGVLGRDPSLFNMMATGGDWRTYFNEGGPSLSMSIDRAITKRLGLPNMADPLGIFKPKDTYGPLNTKNDPAQNYAAYFQTNPDVAAEWGRFSETERNRLFAGDPNNYAQWHHSTFGKAEGRNLQPFTAGISLGSPQSQSRPAASAGWTPGQMPTIATLRRG